MANCGTFNTDVNGEVCSGANPGGNKEIYFINLASIGEVVFAGPTVSHIYSTGTVSVTGYKVTARKNSILNEEVFTRAENGSSDYTSTLTFPVDKRDVTKRDALALLNNATVAYIIQENNQSYWLHCYRNGAEVTTNAFTSGTARTDVNGWTVTLSGNSDEFSFPVDPAVIAEIYPAP